MCTLHAKHVHTIYRNTNFVLSSPVKSIWDIEIESCQLHMALYVCELAGESSLVYNYIMTS